MHISKKSSTFAAQFKNKHITPKSRKGIENMKAIDFTQKVYRLNVEDGNMWIEESTLAQVVRESAEETTSPRGVEPKLHVEERDGEWQLLKWGPQGNGEYFVRSCETEEEAEQLWLELTYEYDYIESDNYPMWFNSADEAIKDYVDLMSYEEPTTIEEVKSRIAECDAEHAETVERIKQNEIDTYRKGVETYQKTGTVSKKLRNICSTILLSTYRSGYARETRVYHSDDFKAEVERFFKEVVCKH